MLLRVMLLGLRLLRMLLPVLLLLRVPDGLLLRLLLVDRPVVLLLLRLPHDPLLRLARRGRPERGHGGLGRRRLHRHRLPARPARRVLQGHDPHRLPVGHLRHVDARPRLLDDELLPALQHQHPRLSPVLRPQDLPDGLLHHHAVLLLLLGMVLNVLLLLLLGAIQ